MKITWNVENETIATMGEMFDAWIAQGRKNIWDNPVNFAMLQSEGGAAAVHGATSVSTVCVSFTASQSLLLMIPDLHKIAGELCSAVLFVTACSLATSGLSIYNDHSDVCTGSTRSFSNRTPHNNQDRSPNLPLLRRLQNILG